MYRLSSPIDAISGVGHISAQNLKDVGIFTVQDLLLTLPLRYEDRSTRATLSSAEIGEIYTFAVTVVSTSQYYKGRRSIQKATVEDESGKRTAMWFNNTFIIQKLKKGESYLFSGKLNDRGVLVQPTVEDIKDAGLNIHTDRIIPLYSTRLGMKIGTLRRIFKEVLDGLKIEKVEEDWIKNTSPDIPTLHDTFQNLHFPDTPESVKWARKRLALEELLALIDHSKELKKSWHENYTAQQVSVHWDKIIPETIPYTLTGAQERSIREICTDIEQDTPMNRLLVGDVGAGKTVVAGTAAWHTLQTGLPVAFIAPTQILAHQHAETLASLFPDIEIEIITSQSKKAKDAPLLANQTKQPKLYVGTHSVINRLNQIKPGLLIFDEQHRFGVGHRSSYLELTKDDSSTDTATETFTPHVLTMTATPIPRSFMLTIFDHLHLSTLDEMPAGRQVTKTYLTPAFKREDAYRWILNHLEENQSQIVHVCPFIETSSEPAFEDVASATQMYEEVSAFVSEQGGSLQVGLLHGKQSNKEKTQITDALYSQKINWLVTTPVVEVGLDLPKADIIIIEGAERFGLASLHQLRGRVGRAGQQGHCLLFTSKSKHQDSERLLHFCNENSGFALAEYDLQNRGGGNIFGTEQHGMNELQFANWADLELISAARKIYDEYIEKGQGSKNEWTPLIHIATKDKVMKKDVAAN